MKKFLPIIFIPLFVLLTLPFDVFGSSLEVSKSSNFTSSDLNFSGGQTVYVRVKEGEGSTHILNIRDSGYSTIKSVNLNRNGDIYTASFSAPGSEGYYSLEAKVEGNGSSSVSVKTIKVGSPSSANIKVNVNSSVKGTKSSSLENSENPDISDKSEGQSIIDSESTDPSPESDEVEVFTPDDQDEQIEKPNWVWATVKGVFSFLWPF